MKTTVFFKRIFIRTIVFILIVAYLQGLRAQTRRSISDFANGLVFKNPSVKSGITTGVDAIVSIDDFMNVAFVKNSNNNSAGTGFIDAFESEVQIGGKVELCALLIATANREEILCDQRLFCDNKMQYKVIYN